MNDSRWRFVRSAGHTLVVLSVLWAAALAGACVAFALSLNDWLTRTTQSDSLGRLLDQSLSFLAVVVLATTGSLLLVLTWLAAPRHRRRRVEWLLSAILTLLAFSLVYRQQSPLLFVAAVEVGVAFEGLRTAIMSLLERRSEFRELQASLRPVPNEELKPAAS
jgi:hypothetical protein